MIQFLSVTKEYTGGDIVAVEDISFDVDDGEFVFLVGPSGSGKTTLIKMLIREELPSSGKIFFDDSDITRFKTRSIYQLRRQIGVIFQDFKLIPELNAYENVAFVMEVAGRSEKEIKAQVPYLLDIVGLSDRTHFFPKQLSGGEKQRVAIARAMANNPKLLIADEPTGNLDPESAWDVVQILAKINNWGTTVLMSTHGSDIVNTLHKRVLKLEGGKLIRDDMKGTYEELDDFSLKVISSASSKLNKQDTKPKETNDQDSLKQKQSKQSKSPELKISMKKSKLRKQENNKKAALNSASELEAKVLEKLENEIPDEYKEEEIKNKANQKKLKELDLEKNLVHKLQEAGYTTLGELIEAGTDGLKAETQLKKSELKSIAIAIEKFVAEQE